MKNILLLFMILFCFQNEAWNQEKNPRFRIELSSQSILVQGNILVVAPNIQFYILEKTYNYASHLSAFWRLRNQLELGLGVGYANRDAYARNILCYNGQCKGPNWGEDRHRRIRSLEIPLELRWKYWKSAKKLIPYFSIGIANRIPIINESLNGEAKSTLSSRDYAIGTILGAGAQFNFFEKWSLIFAAQIRKDGNFKFKKEIYENRWINEAVFQISAGRSF